MTKRLLFISPILLILGIVGVETWSIHNTKKWLETQPATSHQALPQNVNQKFYFLSQSDSSAAFASEDGAYIFKLFINNPPHTSSWRQYIPYLANLHKTHQYYLNRKEKFLTCINQSKDLLYYHLGSTNTIKQKIILQDANGATLTVDLDRAEYYIQAAYNNQLHITETL